MRQDGTAYDLYASGRQILLKQLLYPFKMLKKKEKYTAIKTHELPRLMTFWLVTVYTVQQA